MDERLERLITVVRLVARSAVADRITFLAASIAFYAVISIFPLLLLVLVVGSLIGGEAFARTVIGVVEGFFTPETLSIIEEGLVSASGRSSAGIVSVLVLMWSSIKVFRGLDIAFSTVYGELSDPTLLTNLLSALIALLSLGAAIVAIIVLQTVTRMIPDAIDVGGLSPLLSIVALTILFFPMYLVFPGIRQSPIAVLPGTVVAAIGWTVLGELFAIYATHAGTYVLFGVIGGFLLLLMWFYFGAIVLLLGAIVNAVLAGRFNHETPNARTVVERPIGAGIDAQGERDE